jgi:hypothetical protein
MHAQVGAFFSDLLHGRLPYRVVYDRQSPRPPAWVYPRSIDFLHNRIVILERTGQPQPRSSGPAHGHRVPGP